MTKPLHTTGTPDAIDRALERLTATGCVTFHPVTGEFPTEGFALSIYRDREQIIRGEVKRSDLLGFVLANADLLVRNGTVVGGWTGTLTGLTYLDVWIIESDKNTALVRASANSQLAIFDLASKEEIYL